MCARWKRRLVAAPLMETHGVRSESLSHIEPIEIAVPEASWPVHALWSISPAFGAERWAITSWLSREPARRPSKADEQQKGTARTTAQRRRRACDAGRAVGERRVEGVARRQKGQAQKGDCDLQVCRATSARCAMRPGKVVLGGMQRTRQALRNQGTTAGCAHMTGCCWARRRASFRARCGACASRSASRSFVWVGLAVEKEELAQPPVTITAPCRHSSSTK